MFLQGTTNKKTATTSGGRRQCIDSHFNNLVTKVISFPVLCYFNCQLDCAILTNKGWFVELCGDDHRQLLDGRNRGHDRGRQQRRDRSTRNVWKIYRTVGRSGYFLWMFSIIIPGNNLHDVFKQINIRLRHVNRVLAAQKAGMEWKVWISQSKKN